MTKDFGRLILQQDTERSKFFGRGTKKKLLHDLTIGESLTVNGSLPSHHVLEELLSSGLEMSNGETL